MAFEPAPTQATMASGSRPNLYLPADHRLEVAHDPGVRGRPHHAPDDVVGIRDVRHPISYCLVHRIFERHRAARNGHDLGPEELHPDNVQLLTASILFAHVYDALLAIEGCDGRGSNPMLARPGFGDDAFLAHTVGEQDLP